MVKKSLLNRAQKKIAMIIFEIFMFFVALIFIMPVILSVLNSFKTNSEIQMSVGSLPRLVIRAPKKVDKAQFQQRILNRLIDDEDKETIKSYYQLRDGDFFINSSISGTEKKEIVEILKKTGTYSTIFESFTRNYIGSWEKTKFPSVFINTLIITLFSTLLIIIISSMAAYALVRTKWKLSWVLFLVFTFGMVVPFQAIMFPLVKTADSLGLLSTFIGIILIYGGVGCPMAIIMFHGFIKGVPLELEESAAIDGAGKFTVFFQIILPLLTPITATIVILDVLWIWNDFLLPLIILVDRDYRTIQIAQYITRGAFNKDFGLELASLVLAATPIIIFYLYMQKFIIKGITAGAVKG